MRSWYYHFRVVLLRTAHWSIYLPVAIARLQFWQQALALKQSLRNSVYLPCSGCFVFTIAAANCLATINASGSYPEWHAMSETKGKRQRQKKPNFSFFSVSGWLN